MYKFAFVLFTFLSCSAYGQDTTFNEADPTAYWIVTDTATTYQEFYPNGNLKRKIVSYHPEGRSSVEDFEKIKRLEMDFDENGKIAGSYEYFNNKLHGDYLMYDDPSFVTHLVFRNDSLVDILNANCCFVDNKGKIITKELFFNHLYSQEFGEWDYYLFEEWGRINDISCCDFAFISEKYIARHDLKERKKLIKRLKKNCS